MYEAGVHSSFYVSMARYRLFVQPLYDSILLEQSLIYNRRKDEYNFRENLAVVEEEERDILPDEGKPLPVASTSPLYYTR